MGKLYPVEQRHVDEAKRIMAGSAYPIWPADAEANIAAGLARFEAEHLTRIAATPAVDREGEQAAIAYIRSWCPDHVLDYVTTLKQSDGLAERVREACAAEAEKAIRAHSDAYGPSGGAWNISMVLGAVLPAIRSLDITRMDSDG